MRAFNFTPILLLALFIHAGTRAEMVAYFPFDQDFSDASGSENHLIIGSGSPSISTVSDERAFGSGALDLDSTTATQEYLNFTTSINFAAGDPWSVVFWARHRPGSDGRTGMIAGNLASSDFIWIPNDGAVNGIRFRNSAGTNGDYNNGIQPTGEFHHWALIADGSGSIEVFYDNATLGSRTLTTTIQITSIGQAFTSAVQSMNGQIDEFYIYDEAINSDKVEELFQMTNEQDPEPKLVLHFPFDEGFDDISPSANNGTSSGNASILNGPDELVTGDGALSLDGTSGTYVELLNPLTFTSSDPWTATWWARRMELDVPNGTIMGERTSEANFVWLSDDVGGLHFRSANSIDHDFTIAQDTELHHYGLVADGLGGLHLYRDGMLAESSTGDTAFAIDSVGLARPDSMISFGFAGTLDEVRIYEGALNAAQIASIHDLENPVPPPPVSRLRVFLIAGQSNADGRGNSTNLPTSPANLQAPQEDIDFYEGTSGPLTHLQPGSTFGPEITLGRTLADVSRGDLSGRIAIIKYALGGTDLKDQWRGGGDGTTTGDGPQYLTFQTTVVNGLVALTLAYPEAKITIEGLVWVQGERDARLAYESEYETNLNNFIADIRQTYSEDLPFVVVRLSSSQTNLPTTNLNGIRAAQTAVANADPRVSLIESDSFGMLSDNLHFDALGQQQIGEASAIALTSFFPISTLEITPAIESPVQLRLPKSLNGFQYTLQTSDSLTPSSWQAVESRTSAGGALLFQYAIDPAARNRFFRVARSPQP